MPVLSITRNVCRCDHVDLPRYGEGQEAVGLWDAFVVGSYAPVGRYDVAQGRARGYFCCRELGELLPCEKDDHIFTSGRDDSQQLELRHTR